MPAKHQKRKKRSTPTPPPPPPPPPPTIVHQARPPSALNPDQATPIDCRCELLQNDTSVTIELFLKNAREEDVLLSIRESRFVDLFGFTADHLRVASKRAKLFGAVYGNPEQYHLRVTPYKIELKLQKCEVGQWPSIEVEVDMDTTGSDVPKKVDVTLERKSSSSDSSLLGMEELFAEKRNPAEEEDDFGISSLMSSPENPDEERLLLESLSDVDFGNCLGVSGLVNMGNTCYMNSILQCVGSTRELNRYILFDHYVAEVNLTNPLGMQGKMVNSYAMLLKCLWSNKRTSVRPQKFKETMALFQPQFRGYMQHDSQELLSFLLDGLHEDLNRIKNKPFIEIKDADGRPDDIVAKEFWENHKRRNDSVIVDEFQGQFKSTVICETCGKVSVTFDPFMHLSVPLPPQVRTVNIFYVGKLQHPLEPTQMSLTMKKGAFAQDIATKVGEMTGVDPNLLVMTVVRGHRVVSALHRHETLSFLEDDQRIFIYEAEKMDPKPSLVWAVNCVVNAKPTVCSYCGTEHDKPCNTCGRCQSVGYCDQKCQRAHWAKQHQKECKPLGELDTKPVFLEEFGPPMMFLIQSETSDPMKLLSKAVSQRMIVDPVKGSEVEPLEVTMGVHQNGGSGSIPHAVVQWTQPQFDLYFEKRVRQWKASSRSAPKVVDVREEAAVSLSDCLSLFSQKEYLEDNDAWYCPVCKTHRRASKQLSLWRLPRHLIVHLKRFSSVSPLSILMPSSKVDTKVEFPVRGLELESVLDPMAPRMESSVYDLYAVSNHYGSLLGGHYTAYCRRSPLSESAHGGDWYEFDDTRSTPLTSASDIVTKAAYVLFYRISESSGHDSSSSSKL